jgi:hypothetical protein
VQITAIMLSAVRWPPKKKPGSQSFSLAETYNFLPHSPPDEAGFSL